MLNIVICDENEEDSLLLTKMIKKNLSELECHGALVRIAPDKMMRYEFHSDDSYIVFMDLIYSKTGSDGIAIAESIREQSIAPAMIFVSSHLEFMPFLLKGNVVPAGFIKKPLRFNDVSDVIKNVINAYGFLKDESFFLLNLSNESYRLPYSQILYFEATQKKINLQAISKRYSFYSSLSAIEGIVKGNGFIRCHNSFIINKAKVESLSFTDMLVTMENHAVLPISRTFKQDVKDAFSDE